VCKQGLLVDPAKIAVIVNLPPPKSVRQFQWNEDCQQGLDTLKEKMVTTPILVFPYWEKTFHVHVDALSMALGAIMAQPRAGELDHPIAFVRRKLS
jgi:hypothetical protein